MAVTDSYATAAEYRAAIIKTDTGDDTQVLTDLTAVSRYLERYLNRFFTVDVGDVTRTYIIGHGFAEPVDGHIELIIDDLSADPTSIKIDEDDDGSFVDETALASTEYELLPLNAAVGPEPRPFTSVLLTPWGDQKTYPHGLHVEIIGKWGWPAVPESIKAAAIQITALLRLETPRATDNIPDDLDRAVRASSQAQAIIWQIPKSYRRVRP